MNNLIQVVNAFAAIVIAFLLLFLGAFAEYMKKSYFSSCDLAFAYITSSIYIVSAAPSYLITQ
ncbi:MAG: hypothetical protein ICV78_06560 [Tolypothrix sp. Co-bin9]|nr:hypothetical protein [Tolypothrix sp. Co-bin9]